MTTPPEAPQPQWQPPTKVCSNCGVQAQTTADKCPNCSKKYKRRTGLKIAGWGCVGLVVGSVVIIVLIALAIGAAVDEAEDEQDRVGITLREFRSIEQRTAQEDVEEQLGEPEDSQEFESQIPELQDAPQESSCIYYPEKGKPLLEGRSFQFCFDDGRLTSKNSY